MPLTKKTQDNMTTIRRSIFGEKRFFHTSNSIGVSGWLLQTPKLRVMTKGVRCLKFTLFQLNEDGGYDLYPCQTFEKDTIDTLLKKRYVCLCNCVGRVSYSSKLGLSIIITHIEITHEFTTAKLDDEYVKENYK